MACPAPRRSAVERHRRARLPVYVDITATGALHLIVVSTRGIATGAAHVPAVSVVIPSIGPQILLDQLVRTIISGTKSRVEIIVSHSGPSIPVVDAVVKVIHSDQPLLASAARNRGAAGASGRYLLFLDDDNEVERGLVDGLKQCLDREAGIAVLGPSMYYAADRERPYCFGVLHGTGLGRTQFLVSAELARGGLVWSDALPNAFMMRRDAFIQCGGFDERAFPMVFEESDLQYRLRRHTGGGVACYMGVRIWHHTPLGTRARLVPKTAARFYLLARNRPIFVARHLGVGRWVAYMVVGQFLFCAVRLGGVITNRTLPGVVRNQLVSEYLRGMVAGVLVSFVEVLGGPRQRKPPHPLVGKSNAT